MTIKTAIEGLSETIGEEVVGDADGVGDDGEGWVYGAAGGEEACVDDVEVVEVVGLAIDVEDGGRCGSVPKRQVPFWWPTPSRGMRFLK